ncbi:hypothetical protein OU415_32315 [Saccharopolyspora sp. WRP15-2]|uniref:DUF3800 domain-containing protein n=1 Tax=Saccharopolyspora oryzae TaxID=2997343 RepID=A0ABT4VA27_9PSEU|nr:hypothetical protein [Saccharopolyspora oryzae]MDA3630152.1 hypothetical protein [Saccharopolyspora oryzae]
MPIAYGDESFREHSEHGFYVLTGVVFEPRMLDEAHETLLSLKGRRQKLHWHGMDAAEQQRVVKKLADLEGMHIVVIGSPVPLQKQERARAMCLNQLVVELFVVELYSLGIDLLVLEGRSPDLNQRDLRTVAGARQRLLPKAAKFRVDHSPGDAQPLLWAADIVAGVCRAAHLGKTEHREMLANRVYDVEISTGCHP